MEIILNEEISHNLITRGVFHHIPNDDHKPFEYLYILNDCPNLMVYDGNYLINTGTPIKNVIK